MGLTNVNLRDLQRWLNYVIEQIPMDALKEACIEKEMMRIRIRNYKLVCLCFCHLDFVTGIFLLHEAFTRPGLDTVIPLGFCMLAYVQFLLVVLGRVELTPERLKISSYVFHIGVLICLISTAWVDSSFKFWVMQNFLTAGRFALILALLEPRATVPFQILYSIVEILLYIFIFADSIPNLVMLCCSQLFLLVIAVASSLFIDLALRARVLALSNSADAESLVASFRRLLRAVCDGGVLLDNRMHVAEESESLKHLIFTDVNLKGRSFQHLLVEEERQRFGEFIESSTRLALRGAGTKDSAAPLCSRVALRGSAGIAVATDIYHVPVPGLFGATEPYHLIAFKEDPESRPQPEAEEDAVPAQLLPTWNIQNDQNDSPRPGSPPSMASQGARSSQHSVCFPELEEITLLLDVGTDFHDVDEAHVRFQRQEHPEDLASALQSSMPSLRKLVKPTEWEKLRSKAVNFAVRAADDPDIAPKEIRRMSLQLPDQGRIIPLQAHFKRFRGGPKVWLHMEGFRPERPPRQPSLDGIQEA